MSAERVADTPKKDDEKKTSSKAPVKVVRKSSNPASTTSATDANRPIRRQQQLKPVQPHNPAKIGKANPKRDIPLFLGLVGFLFLVAYSFSGVGTEKKQKSVREMQAELRKHIEASHAREQAKKRTMDCDLFIASSSIPGAGLGVFAGKRYDIGDEVLHPGIFYPVESQPNADETIFVTQYGFLLKHHPHLANLQGGPIWTGTDEPSTLALKAARVIEPGDELFVSFDHHPQLRSNAFSLPTLEDYEVADDIVRDEIKTQRRGARTVAGRSVGVGGAGTALLLLKRTVAKFNKNVAALLPGSPKVLETRDVLGSHTVFSALTNRTVNYLETNGQCLDDVQVETGAEGSSEMGLFARRSIKNGSVIVPVPLYARRRSGSCSATDDDSCTASTMLQDSAKYCFGHDDSSLLLCPLSSATFIQSASSQEHGSERRANAALKWSSRHNMKDIQKLSVDDIVKNFTTSLCLDLVALRPIQPGEQLFIDRETDATGKSEYTIVDDSIYLDGWRDLIRIS